MHFYLQGVKQVKGHLSFSSLPIYSFTWVLFALQIYAHVCVLWSLKGRKHDVHY